MQQPSAKAATSAISEAIAQDKQLTKKLLSAAGVPVPTGRAVSDPEDPWAAACDIGLPVVVKPNDGNQGKGVTVNITNKGQLLKAYATATATKFRDDILVERYMPGNDYRLLVVGDKLVAAAHMVGLDTRHPLPGNQGRILAIDTAMDALIPGELCLILVDQVQEAMAHIAAGQRGQRRLNDLPKDGSDI